MIILINLSPPLRIFALMTQPLTHQELISIAEEFGTPLYVYHAEKITAQYQRLDVSIQQFKRSVFLCL